jgi:hypothetical protein
MVETCFLGLSIILGSGMYLKPTRYCTSLAIFSVVLGYEPGQRSDQTMRPVEACDSVQAARGADGKDQNSGGMHLGLMYGSGTTKISGISSNTAINAIEGRRG